MVYHRRGRAKQLHRSVWRFAASVAGMRSRLCNSSGAIDTAEERNLMSFGSRVTFSAHGRRYTWETQDRGTRYEIRSGGLRTKPASSWPILYAMVILGKFNIALHHYVGWWKHCHLITGSSPHATWSCSGLETVETDWQLI